MTVSSDVLNSQGFEALIAEGGEKLVWIAPVAPLTFRFRWENVTFSGHLSNGGEDHRLYSIHHQPGANQTPGGG